MRKYLDIPSIIVAMLTLALFIAALFVKGFTHDLFLEAGVFLVSIKIIIMMHANRQALNQMGEKLDTVMAALGANSKAKNQVSRAIGAPGAPQAER